MLSACKTVRGEKWLGFSLDSAQEDGKDAQDRGGVLSEQIQDDD